MFTVLYRAQTKGQDSDARLGLAISKKHCKLATGRNRIKRLVRESFRVHRDGMTGLDIIVMNKPAAANANNKTLTDSLKQHWQACSKSALKAAGKN